MKERSLVFFTLLMQASVGLCLCMSLLEIGNLTLLPEIALYFKVSWIHAFLLAAFGLGSSFFHLKTPLHAWRALSNLRTSWLSREILFASIYTVSSLAIASFQVFTVMENFVDFFKGLSISAGLFMIFCMGSAYRLRTVRFWDSRQTIFAFYFTSAILGILITMILRWVLLSWDFDCMLCPVHSGGIFAFLLLLSLYFSVSGYQRLVSGTEESFPQIKRILIFRCITGILAVFLSLTIYFSDMEMGDKLFWPLAFAAILSEFSGRVLFYMAQVPSGVYLLKE